MKTFIQNAHPLFTSLANLLLIAGLVFCLGSCTPVEKIVEPIPTVEPGPVVNYTGHYELMEDNCSTSKNRLEIHPYAPNAEPNQENDQTKKMISISNLGPMTDTEVTAVWNGDVFIIERQEVLNGDELIAISGELDLDGVDDLSVFYEISSPKEHHSCVAEYKKY